MRLQSNRPARPRLYRGGLWPALAGLVLFVVWTVAVRACLAQGRAQAAWTAQAFGSWPSSFGILEGSGHEQFSLYATYDAAATTAGAGAAEGMLGNTAIGSVTDTGDANHMNGSRFVTGPAAGSVSSIAVHVAGPVDIAPHDQFQVAIYTDAHDAPYKLVASSATGTLTAPAWNTVPIRALLKPHTAYWLMYNTNGTSDAVNGMSYTALERDPIDRLLQAPHARWLDRFSDVLGTLGGTAVTAAVALGMAVWLGRKRPLLAALLLAAFALGLLLEVALKRWLFYPVSGSYPSGHALRAVLLAAVVVYLVPRRAVQVGVLGLALLIGLSRVHAGEHYWYEAVGGALAGWTLAAALVAASQFRRPAAPTRE
jgi:hypothetical protein